MSLMISIANIEFVQPWWLVLLALLPVLAWYSLKRTSRRRSKLRFSSLEAFGGGVGYWSFLLNLLPLLKLVGIALLIIAMARPRSLLREEKIRAEGIDIFLVMDISLSMLSRDFDPNRITVATQVAAEFVAGRQYDRLGLSVFGGESFTQSPLTTDLGLIQQLLSNLEIGILGDGTAIGNGLASAVNRLRDSEAKSKVIILLTDGVNTKNDIDPMTAAKIAKEFDISVYTIGIGSRGRAMSPSRYRGNQLQFAMRNVNIDEKLLRSISSLTGGRYYRATDEEALVQVYEQIDELEKTEIEVTTVKRYAERFRPFTLAALWIILAYFILSASFLQVNPD